MAKAFVTPQPVTITVDDVRRDRPKGSAPAEGKMPSMPQGHEHAHPGSQLPLTPFLIPPSVSRVQLTRSWSNEHR
jgi:hypothetical protein